MKSAHSRLPVLATWVLLLLLPSEAKVSVYPEYIDLGKMTVKSAIVLVAKQSKENSGLAVKYEVREVLKGKDLGVETGKTIEVYPANYDLHKSIGEASKRGEATPMPILDFYKSSLGEKSSDADVILFLSRNGLGELQFAVEGGFESPKMKSTIAKLISTTPSKQDPATIEALVKFDSLVQVIQDGEAADARMKSLRRQKKPFIEAIPYRNLLTCQSGTHQFTNTKYLIYSGKKSILGTEERLEVSNDEIHEARDHGAKLSATLLLFLSKI